MIILLIFAFIAGIVTILSPCILPILPIILSSAVDTSGKLRPLGIIIGFMTSFTFFTLFLTTIVRLSGIPADWFRSLSVFILLFFGVALLIPSIQLFLEKIIGSIIRNAPKNQNKHGFLGGIGIGFSLGLLWTPCVGPILASVISLALAGAVTLDSFLITLAYSAGTGLPMFVIMQTGNTALRKIPWMMEQIGNMQKIFGVIMIITSIGILMNFDRKFQTFILTAFPSYGAGITAFEDNNIVKQALKNFQKKPINTSIIGKPMNENIQNILLSAPEILPGGEWFNSEPLILKQLHGKVILIDFWTYTCINCQRTLPYLRDWWNKYENNGLVIIGVHTPEFEFEKNPFNLRKAIADFSLSYPIVQDNEFKTWNNYNNRYWPAKYLIDKKGFIRYTHFGEGKYDETEKMIQNLLSEESDMKISNPLNNSPYEIYSTTPETYLGYGRLHNFSSREHISENLPAEYTLPEKIPNHTVAYGGQWTIMKEYANPSRDSILVLNFEAKNVFLVMRTKGISSQVKVRIDDVYGFAGDDVIDGVVTVDSDRLYNIVDLPEPGKHELKMDFLDDDMELYAFTFG